MKRINYDELIWFILLVILNFLMFFLIKSDEIQNFINGRMLIFFKFSVIILVLFSICQFPKIFTIPSRRYITNKFFPLIFFVIILLLYFAYPDDRNEVINDSFNNISDITENIDDYDGEKLYFKGFIYVDKEESGKVYLARERLTCCQYDSRIIKIPLLNMEDINEDTWIIVYGKVIDDDGLKLKVVDYEKCSEPEDRFLKED